MNQIDINKAKEYNESVKLYRNMASQLQAEIKVNREQLAACCAELSQELNMEVTESNLREVLEAQEQKIESIMNVGNAVINKIKSEQNANTVNPVNNMNTANAGVVGSVQSQGIATNNLVNGLAGSQVGGVDVQNMFGNGVGQSQEQLSLNNLAGQQMNAPFFKI